MFYPVIPADGMRLNKSYFYCNLAKKWYFLQGRTKKLKKTESLRSPKMLLQRIKHIHLAVFLQAAP